MIDVTQRIMPFISADGSRFRFEAPPGLHEVRIELKDKEVAWGNGVNFQVGK
jgi:hypothetical protein